MILLIDNYDSFVYNLARYVGKLGRARQVVRNDAITLDAIAAMAPEAIILSPGPCTPHESGICNNVIEHFSGRFPILGICLGHQCIAEQFGGRTVPSPYPCHGKTSMIQHNADELFMGLPNPLEGARYHSLITEISAGSPLEITAHTEDDDIIMGLKHKDMPVYGLQFHPESVMTPYGLDIIRNFMAVADQWNEKRRRAA
ncbi:MAG: aminodeoxychorismate/anthranilate synthase component II [Rhodospirillales bacterium]|nr:aminodeoxychorismate/anthranilate synthase component II [Rhodospirillales bacterium]MCB9995096.1 aminodeoxychorismate/anthranilate synthase component II [Rhodospirillales bacterium]